MGYQISTSGMDKIIRELSKDYRIYAPKRFEKRGWNENTDLIRYGEIKSLDEIVSDEKSHFSPKEVIYPIMQTLLYFRGNECIECGQTDDKGIIIFMRPCDINGIRRLDTIFLQNGDQEDLYYKRMREKLKVFMIECRKGWDTCFCVSMGSNKSDDYSIALRLGPDGLLADVKDEAFANYFRSEPEKEFTPEFIKENMKKVKLPKIVDKKQLQKAVELEMWNEYNDKCISCGGCNTVCGTCSCFDTMDVIYNETSRDGERRRLWSSCMLESFSTMAGGHNVRKTPGERMRFKTLHKIYDFKNRFGAENMCVGCGRCDVRCPQEISFSGAINRLAEEMKKIGEVSE